MQIEYLIAIGIGIYLLYKIIRYIAGYPERKRLREYEQAEMKIIDNLLSGFSVSEERERVINLLRDTLPEGYRCSRRNCDGILLKKEHTIGDHYQSSYYVCSNCHNLRHTVRNINRGKSKAT